MADETQAAGEVAETSASATPEAPAEVVATEQAPAPVEASPAPMVEASTKAVDPVGTGTVTSVETRVLEIEARLEYLGRLYGWPGTDGTPG